MTCIIGYVNDGIVYMGGDSAGVGGLDIRSRSDEKVFIRDNMIFGYTTSFRMGQLLRFSLNIPIHHEEKTDYEYMCTDFITTVIRCFKDNGYARIKENEHEGGIFLVGYKGNLYRIESDFQVGMHHDSYDACGCGESYALASMKILHEYRNYLDITPEFIIEESLKTVVKFSAGVREPFIIRHIGED